jgi:hypothetical protein
VDQDHVLHGRAPSGSGIALGSGIVLGSVLSTDAASRANVVIMPSFG